MSFAPPKEADLTQACLDYLAMQGVFAWRQNSGCMKVGTRFVRFVGKEADGISDIIGVMPDGRFLAIETKLPGAESKYNAKAKARLAKQVAFLDLVKKRGGVAVLAHSLDELQKALEAATGTLVGQSGRWVAE